MHKLYDLKDMLCEELEKYGDKRDLSAGSLDVVDKLAHAIKNIDKIIEAGEEEGYSERYMYDDGSYARGRGRNAKRDPLGRYSRDGDYRRGYSRDAREDYRERLMKLMDEAPDENTRQSIGRMIDKM